MTKIAVDICGNCLMTSFFIDNDGHLILNKGRLWVKENDVITLGTITIGYYNKDTVNCIRLFPNSTEVTFYFRDEIDAFFAKMTL